jgi:hypothetical protein
LKAGTFIEEDLVRRSPAYKYIVDIGDLTRPLLASKGVLEALAELGVSEAEEKPFDFAEVARKSADYEVSGTRALEIIRLNPRWIRGSVLYVEVHCISTSLGGIWADALIIPLPDCRAALIEFAPSRRGAAEGFWIRYVEAPFIPAK